MDDLGKLGAGHVTSIYGIESKLKPIGQLISWQFVKIVANEHVIPTQMFDHQGGIAERASDRFERENVLWLKLDNFMGAIVFDKIDAV